MRVILGLGALTHLPEAILPRGRVVPFHDVRLPTTEVDTKTLANCILAVACSQALSTLSGADGWFVDRALRVGAGVRLHTQGWRGAQLRQTLGPAADDPRTLYAALPLPALMLPEGETALSSLPNVLDVGSGEAKLYHRDRGWVAETHALPRVLHAPGWRAGLEAWLLEKYGPERLLHGTYCFATGIWREVCGGETTGQRLNIVVLDQLEEARNEFHAVCAAMEVARRLGHPVLGAAELAGYVGYGGGSTQGFLCENGVLQFGGTAIGVLEIVEELTQGNGDLRSLVTRYRKLLQAVWSGSAVVPCARHVMVFATLRSTNPRIPGQTRPPRRRLGGTARCEPAATAGRRRPPPACFRGSPWGVGAPPCMGVGAPTASYCWLARIAPGAGPK
jgi:hypothetical protein